MYEKENLQKLLDSQLEEYNFLGKKYDLIDEKDVEKLSKLANSRNRLSKSIRETIELMMDPEREMSSEKEKQDLVKIAQKVFEEKSKIEKTPLMMHKNALIRKRRFVVRKRLP